MSVLDELQKMEERVQSRLRELKPLVGEYEELQQLAKRFGIESDGESKGANARAQRSSRPATKRAARSTRSGSGARRAGGSRGGGRQEQIVQLVEQRPGITVRELGTQLGVDPTGLYRPVRRLESEGRVRKDGAALHPAG
jgi:hypothetical protein